MKTTSPAGPPSTICAFPPALSFTSSAHLWRLDKVGCPRCRQRGRELGRRAAPSTASSTLRPLQISPRPISPRDVVNHRDVRIHFHDLPVEHRRRVAPLAYCIQRRLVEHRVPAHNLQRLNRPVGSNDRAQLHSSRAPELL